MSHRALQSPSVGLAVIWSHSHASLTGLRYQALQLAGAGVHACSSLGAWACAAGGNNPASAHAAAATTAATEVQRAIPQRPGEPVTHPPRVCGPTEWDRSEQLPGCQTPNSLAIARRYYASACRTAAWFGHANDLLRLRVTGRTPPCARSYSDAANERCGSMAFVRSSRARRTSAAPSTSRIASTTNGVSKPPVESSITPVNAGPANPPRFPTAAINAIPAAAAVPVRNAVGIAPKTGIAERTH